ncbi:TetR family transcriptional regulator C-terminal domain-containing protein [Acidovorax cavernicola]|uniref:TetR family transcriptional regulator C-terminal domain-containing protein n=1 Tax=Acidovorax cavernicola TaxID=1675792 RepID=UPI00142D3BFC|nr:TetR family transcriptional regulator C-terminal domain-containing protein [Acidovorax cavernicola]
MTQTKTSRDAVNDAIWQAATEEFALHGLRGTSTQGIAERAGMSKARLHYYIESKEALYTEILQHVIEEWSRASFTDGNDDAPAVVIERYVRRKLDFSFTHPQLSKIFANEMTSGAPVLQTLLSASRLKVGSAIQQLETWIEQGLLRPLDPLLLMMNIWSITQHFADFEFQTRYMMRLKAGEKFDTEHIAREVVDFVLRGCGFVPTEATVASAAPATRPPTKTKTRR